MKARDLLKMPLGKYRATDGFFNYDFEKVLYENQEYYNGLMWKLSPDHYTLTSVYIYIDYKNAYDDMGPIEKRQTPLPNFKYPVIELSTSVAGIRLYSRDSQYALSEIKLLPRGSFKQYVQNEI